MMRTLSQCPVCVCVCGGGGGGTFTYYIFKSFADFFRFKTLNFDIYLINVSFLGAGVVTS